ncbi:MAG: hypothetical protein R3B57_00890 [Phycisphaerales bacterium]
MVRPRLIALLACLLPTLAAAQEYVQVPDDPGSFNEPPLGALADPARRPDSAGRVVAFYDFEEELTNPLPVPVGWARGQNDPEVSRDRPGFPIWNAAELDYDAPAFRGAGSVRLPVKGDSTSLMLIPGVLSVFAEGDYLASAQVRTRGLTYARAQLVARLLDKDLAPIKGAESRSPLVTSEGQWTRLEAPINGSGGDAAYLQLELLVLQPEQYDPIPPDASYRVARQDYDGAAWFDDVGVIAIPRIEIVPDAPAALAVGDTPPALDMLVRDLAGQAINVEILVRDADDQVVDHLERDMPGGRFVERWRPNLPVYGWYRADMIVRAGDAPRRIVGSATSAFAWAPDAPAPSTSVGAASGAPSVGLNTASLPDALARELPRLAHLVGARSVDVCVWDRDAPPETGDALADRIAPLVDQLLLDQVRVTLSIASVPPDIATGLNIDVDDVVSLLARDQRAFGDLADPLLDRYGQRIQRWGLGSPSSAAPFAHTKLDADLDRATSAVARLVTAPIVDVPWRTDQAIVPAIASPGRAATIHVVPGTSPEAHAALVAEWEHAVESVNASPSHLADPTSLTVSLEALDENVFGVRAAAADLARQTLTLWQAFTKREFSGSPVTIALLDPWRVVDERRPRVEPTPALPVWRTLSARLRGRRVALQLPLAEGIHALLLEPVAGADTESDAALAVWSDTPRVIDLNLGESALTRIDLFGNRSPVDMATREDPADAPAAHLAISPEPIFIEGVDARLVHLLASIRLAPRDLPGDRDEHVLTLSMTNPWGHVIQGALYVVEPGGFSEPETPVDRSWRITPRKVPFMLGAGESLAQTIIVAHSLAEEAGVKPAVVDVALVADRDRGVHRVRRSLEVGLPGVSLDLSTRRSSPDEPSPFIALDANVTNISDASISFDLLVVAPGQPRVRRHIADLRPGESATRTFAFPADESLHAARIAVGLERTDAEGRLNKTVLVE